MTLNLSAPHVENELKPRIVVVGVGGAGCNAVNNMITANLEGVEFVVANTDAQALALSHSERRIQLGTNITHGLGAGARPDIGRASAEEALDSIIDHLSGGHMAFITAGMGGGTGTGAAPVIARAAREHGILTVGVVTKPFHFEGTHRMALADEGIEELQHFVDTLIVIPNQNLFRVCNEKTTFADAFRMADNVLYSGVRGVTDLMVMPGLINLDFADIRTVMSEMGKAMMGTGEASGDRRAIEAAEAAIANPLLDDVSMKGARGVLINITGGTDMTLFEVDEAANRIREEVDQNAHIIFGSTFDTALEGIMRVSIVATGIEADGTAVLPRPGMISLVHDADRPITVPSKPSATPEAESIPPVPATGQVPNMPAAAMASELAAPAPAQEGEAATSALALDAATEAAAGGAAPVVPTQSLPDVDLAEPAAEPAAAGNDPEPTKAPAAAERPFIAPPPVRPGSTTSPVRGPSATPNDPAAAAKRPAPEEGAPERRRGFSLFQRVTGAVGTRRPELPDQELELTASAPAPVPSEPALPTTEAALPAASAPARAQPELPTLPAAAKTAAPIPPIGRLDLDDRPTRLREEEDLLEIPAFLRRQAN